MVLQSGCRCWDAVLQAIIAGGGGKSGSEDWPWETACPETTVVKPTGGMSGVEPLKCELKCSFVPCSLLLAQFGGSWSTGRAAFSLSTVCSGELCMVLNGGSLPPPV